MPSTQAAVPPVVRRRSLRRWLLGAAAFFVLLFGGALTALYVYGPYLVIVPGRLERTFKYSDVTPAGAGLDAERCDVEVESGLSLRGWFIHGSGAVHGTVVLLHGHGSCKESTFPLARLLAANGYQSLVYDSRGHGESGGRFCTFGYYEHTDCSRFVDAAQGRFPGLGPVAIQGESFGGAVALQTLAEDRRFRCGIVQSTFADLREQVNADARAWVHFFEPPLMDTMLRRAGEIAHFPPAAVRPEEAAGAVRCPVLLIHGADDQRIPVQNGERIFAHLQTPGCEWYPVSGADHGGVWHVGAAEYERRVLDFLARHEH